MKIVYKKNALSNTVPEMQGATPQAAGSGGLVPTPLAGDSEKFLKGDGTWAENRSSSNFTGTLAEWNDLTQAEQEEYDTVDLEDDYNGWPVDNVPTVNSNNLVKSGGVYSAVQTLTNKVDNITNPNLLDNPWFTVNQRGFATIAKGLNGYTVDRWKKTANAGSVSINNGIISIDGSEESSNGVVLDQYLENIDNLIGKVVTASLLLSDNSIVYGSNTIPSSGNISFVALSNVAVSLNSVNSSPYFRIRVTPATTVSIKAVKLELGSVSTLAMDTSPNYATELLKCQRYFYGEFAHKYAILGYGYATSTTNVRIKVPLSVLLRAVPSITIDASLAYIFGNGGSIVPSSITVQGLDSNGVQLNVTVTNAVLNELYILKLNNTTLALSADL